MNAHVTVCGCELDRKQIKWHIILFLKENGILFFAKKEKKYGNGRKRRPTTPAMRRRRPRRRGGELPGPGRPGSEVPAARSTWPGGGRRPAGSRGVDHASVLVGPLLPGAARAVHSSPQRLGQFGARSQITYCIPAHRRLDRPYPSILHGY